MRRMIPQNQQEVLKKLTEKKQFLQDVTITGNVKGYSLVIDSDGISYFMISGFASPETSDEEYIIITGTPIELSYADGYPASTDLGSSEFVTIAPVDAVDENAWKITFAAGTAERNIYFSVMLSQVVFDK